jgi:hypothetical protein
VRADGKVTKEDYERSVVPLLDEARRDGKRLRVLCEVAPGFDGFTASGAWEDVKLGVRSIRRFDGLALVTDIAWIREATRLAAFFMPSPVKAFASVERARAIEWLESLPEAAAVSHHLEPETGVLVVEVSQPLRVQDFDALAVTADSWIEAHGDLPGLVIHTREFPGWENLRGVIRHVQFVRDHHRNVRRIALAADTKLASLAPRLGEHFIAAEVKTFRYDDLASAVAWAESR